MTEIIINFVLIISVFIYFTGKKLRGIRLMLYLLVLTYFTIAIVGKSVILMGENLWTYIIEVL